MKYLKKWKRLIAALLCVFIITQSMPQLVIATEIVQSDAQEETEAAVDEEEAATVSATEVENSAPEASRETDITTEENSVEQNETVAEQEIKEEKLSAVSQESVSAENIGNTTATGEKTEETAEETTEEAAYKTVEFGVSCEEASYMNITINNADGVVNDIYGNKVEDRKLSTEKSADESQQTGCTVKLYEDQDYTIEVTLPDGVAFKALKTEAGDTLKTEGGTDLKMEEGNKITLTKSQVAGLKSTGLIFELEHSFVVQFCGEDGLGLENISGKIITDKTNQGEEVTFHPNTNGRYGVELNIQDANKVTLTFPDLYGLKVTNAALVNLENAQDISTISYAEDGEIQIKDGWSEADQKLTKLRSGRYVLQIDVEPCTTFTLAYSWDKGFSTPDKTLLNPKIGTVTVVEESDNRGKLIVKGRNGYYVKSHRGAHLIPDVSYETDAASGETCQVYEYRTEKNIYWGDEIKVSMGTDTSSPTTQVSSTYQQGTEQEASKIISTDENAYSIYVTNNEQVNIGVSAVDDGEKYINGTSGDETDKNKRGVGVNKDGIYYTLDGTDTKVMVPGENNDSGYTVANIALNNISETTKLTIGVPDRYGNETKINVTVYYDNQAPLLSEEDAIEAENFVVKESENGYYWRGDTQSPQVLLNIKEENDPITFTYSIWSVGDDGQLKNRLGKEQTVELENLEDTLSDGFMKRRLSINLKNTLGKNSLDEADEGTYSIQYSMCDFTEKNVASGELVRFEINRHKPIITIKNDVASGKWVNSPDKTITLQADIEFFSASNSEEYRYAVTSAFGDEINSGSPKEPEQSDCKPISYETLKDGNGTATVNVELPLNEYEEKNGTVRFYIWAFDDVLNQFNVSEVTYHIDNTQPEITSVKAEKSSANESLRGRIYRYIFGTALSDEETLKFTISAKDKAADGAVYLTDDQPEIQKVSLYYVLADDADLAKMSVSEQYQWLKNHNVKEENVKAVENADGTYTAELTIKEKNKFYKLYVLAKDKAGNITIKSVAQLTENQDEYSISQIMVDNKKPEIKTALQKDSKADYTEKRDGKKYNWYAADSAINYDVTVKDAESGIFSVEALVNGTALKKDANGTKFYDSNSYYQKDKSDKMKLETKFTYAVNLKQGSLEKDGKSTIQIDVADNAGNTNSVKKVVYVDEDAPAISHMEFDTGAKDDLSTVPTQYGYFFQKATTVTVYATDYIGDSDIIGSGVAKMVYQLNPADDSEPTTGELEVTANADGTYTAQFAIPEGFKGQIEVKAIDNVGQDSGFYNPKGAVVETAEEHATTSDAKILLPETEYADAEGNPLYASDVTLQLVAADGRSGLKENNWSVKEHYAADALAGGTLQVTSVFDEASRTWSSVCGGDADWSIPNALDLNLVTSAQKNVVVASDTNHIEAALQITDNAGNVSGAEGKTFSIDKTAPVVTVEYDNNNVLNEKYYKEKRTATITVVDANFSEENCTFDITGPNANVSGWTHHAAAGCDGTVHTAECYYTCQVEFAEDGDYKFDFHCTDRAGHTAGMQAPDEFTIDTALPVITVSYDNNAGNANYYSEARTATIEVNDKNFNPATTQVDVTASLEGTGIAVPQPSAFTQNGDVWTASVSFSADGDYSLHVTATDQAGNEAEEYALDEFTVDTTVPEVTISGVEDHSANQGTVAPTIQCSDINMNTDSISVTLTGANNGATAFESSRTVTGSEATISIADIQHTEQMDDLYTLEVSVQDQAGNETMESVLFSVNRFGSVYVVDDKTKTLVDNFYTNQEQDVIITEVNVDILQYSEIDYSLDGDIVTLEKDKDYTVTSKTDEASWKMYEYCIDKSNFEKEGSYVVSVYSEDLAQNKSSNKAKGEELAFVVDKTAPTIVIAGVEDNGQYMDAKRNVTIDTQDNILLDNVEVYVGDAKRAAAGQDELLESDGQISLGIDGANKSQELYVVAKDAAGNIAKSENIRFLITKNVLVQWYSNVPLCVGSSTAAVGITGLVVFRKRIPFRNLKRVVKGRK